jgi:adenosylcobinamide-GDP ribazoletransferase
MMTQIRLFLIAAQFLTRFPLGQLSVTSTHEVGRSAIYYPLVGLALGAALAFTAAACAAQVSPLLAAAITLAMWMAATGGLHLDGLADSADAWACGGDRERTLAVMKDPSCGPAAVSTVAAVLLLKFAALTALIEHSGWLAVAIAPMLARACAVTLFLTTPYVRPLGLGWAIAENLPRALGWTAAATAVGGAVTAGGTGALLAAGAAAAALATARRTMLGRIGGATGDTVGAVVEITETAALVAAAFFC